MMRAHLLIVLIVIVLVVIVVLILLILLALRLKNGNSNTVEVTHAILRNDTAALAAVFQHANSLKALKNLALHSARSRAVVRRTEATVLRATMQLAERTYTNRLVQVDMTRKGSSANVPPVRIVRGLLLVGCLLYTSPSPRD